jgi:hypothetical protein
MMIAAVTVLVPCPLPCLVAVLPAVDADVVETEPNHLPIVVSNTKEYQIPIVEFEEPALK